jgi:hypothetical protein
MAKYRITSPDGASFEITAPDTASEAEVKAYAQKSLAGAGTSKMPSADTSFIRPGGYSQEDVETHYKDATRDGEPGVVRRMLDAGTLGAADEILAGAGAPIEWVTERMRGRDPSMGEAYAKGLAVQRRLRDTARKNTDGYGMAVDLAGGMLMAPAAGAAAVAGQAASLGQMAVQGAKIGAPIGAAQAIASSDGEVGDRLAAAPAGAMFGGIGGAVLAPVLPGAIDAAGRGARAVSGRVQGMLGRTPQNTAASQAAAQDFADIGVAGSDVFGPAVAAAPWQRATAESLTGSMGGSALRAGVTRSEAAIEQRLADALRRSGAPPTAEQAGAMVQDLARRPTTGRRLPDDLSEMPFADLARHSGLNPVPDPMGRNAGATTMDMTGSRNIIGHPTTFPDQFAAAYGVLDRMVPSTIRGRVGTPGSGLVPADNTYRMLDEYRGALRSRGLVKGDDRSADIFRSPASADIERYVRGKLPNEVADTIYGRGMISMHDIKDMRGEVRRMVTAPPGDRTPDEAFLKRFEGALSNDMHGLLRRRGRADASNTMSLIDRQYANHQEAVVGPLLAKVFGPNITGETAMRNLVAAAEGRDTRLLRAFYTAARREGRSEAATATVLSHLSRDGITGFAEGVRRLPPESRAVMFGGQSSPLGQSVDKFVRVIDRLQPYLAAREASKAGIDMSRVPNMLAMASPLAGFQTFFAAIGGQVGIARFMSSPRYVDWLTRAVQIRQGGSNAAWTSHVARLRAIAGTNDAVGRAVLESAGELLRPVHASPQEVDQ